MAANESIRGEPDRQISYASGGSGNYDLIMVGFVVMFLLSNIGATKLIEFGPDWAPFGIQLLPIVTDGGALLFPLAYIFGDILAEVYGLAKSKRAIFTGFAAALLASLTFMIIDWAPAATGWFNTSAWHSVLGFVPRIVMASLAGYLAGQLLNAFVLVKIKERTSEKSLWVRLLASTLIGELVDTVIFCSIAFGGLVTPNQMFNYILFGYVYKVTVEIVLMPVTAQVIKVVKKHEPDYYGERPDETEDVNSN